MPQRLRRLLVHPRLPWIAAAVAVAFSLPSLLLGLMADDHLHKARILGDPTIPVVDHVTLQLFEFFPGTEEGNAALAELGVIPWWAAPDLKATFLRPLAAWTHVADHELWPHKPWLMHAHNLLWLGLAVGAVALVYRRLHGSGALAGLAALLFAMEDAHAGPAGWIANRNALVALAFAAAALLLHDRWRRRRWLAGGVLAAGAYLIALLAGEAALALTPYLFAYALLMDRAPAWKRALALAPYAVISLGWIVWYQHGGYGTAGSDMYVDPVAAPLSYARAVVERVPVLLLNQWTPAVCDAWAPLPTAAQLAWTGVGVLFLVGLGWVVWPTLQQRREARFWALGMVLCLLPVCAAFPMDRLLLFCGLGAFGLLACAADRAGLLGKRAEGGWLRRWAVIALLVIHLPLGALLKPARFVPLYATLESFDVAAAVAPDEPAVAGQQLIFVNGVSFLVGYVPIIRSVEGGTLPAGQDFLLHLLEDAELTRVDETTLRARVDGGLLRTRVHQLVRTPSQPFAAGEVFERPAFSVTVDQVTPDGRPEVVTYRFETSLDDPGLRWLVWREMELEQFEVPAVGQTVRVQPSYPPLPDLPWVR